jgi:hypothetical protein
LTDFFGRIPADSRVSALNSLIQRLVGGVRLGNNARLRADAEFGEAPMIRAYADVLDPEGRNVAFDSA